MLLSQGGIAIREDEVNLSNHWDPTDNQPAHTEDFLSSTHLQKKKPDSPCS